MIKSMTILKTMIFAVVFSLLLASAWAEPLTFRVVVTSVDQDIYLVKPDPAFHQQRGQGYIRTTDCKRQAPEDESASIIMASLGDSTAMLVFGTEESCAVINASMDRGTV